MVKMKMMAFTSLLLLLVIFIGQGRSGFIEDEENLRQALLSNYSSQVRPELTTSIVVNLFIMSLNQLDIASQSMSINCMFHSLWSDSRLVWNDANYGGLDTLTTASEDIWTPPLVIENSVDDLGVVGGQNRDGTPVRFDSSGLVVWYPPTEVTVSCEMIIAHYPFDTQTCSVVIIGWTYPLSEMDVSPGIVNTNIYIPHGEFDLVDMDTSTSSIGGPALSETYKKVIFKLTFRRKWLFYGQNLLMPIVLNSILMNAVFLLPIESGEKMGYSLTVLLSYTVFLTWVTENLPPVSTDTSILQVYLAVVLCLGCLATLLTTWILHVYHQPSNRPLSRFYVIMATRLLVPLRDRSCFRSRWKPKTDGGDAQDKHGKTRIHPADLPQRGSRFTQPGIGVFDVGESDMIGIKEAGCLPPKDAMLEESGTAVRRHEARESTDSDPELTWQVVATLLDSFLFWSFAALLFVVTMVIFSLLYAQY